MPRLSVRLERHPRQRARCREGWSLTGQAMVAQDATRHERGYNRRVAHRSEEVTRLLKSIRAGSQDARERLWEVVYEELRDVARARLGHESGGATLQPTMLVNEAILRLAGSEVENWENRAHFFGAAAEAMRRILIDRARRHAAAKRGDRAGQVTLHAAEGPREFEAIAAESSSELLDLDEALRDLGRQNERQARIVELRFFAGLTNEDTARVVGLSRTTVVNEWRFARAWLQREIGRRRRTE